MARSSRYRARDRVDADRVVLTAQRRERWVPSARERAPSRRRGRRSVRVRCDGRRSPFNSSTFRRLKAGGAMRVGHRLPAEIDDESLERAFSSDYATVLERTGPRVVRAYGGLRRRQLNSDSLASRSTTSQLSCRLTRLVPRHHARCEDKANFATRIRARLAIRKYTGPRDLLGFGPRDELEADLNPIAFR